MIPGSVHSEVIRTVQVWVRQLDLSICHCRRPAAPETQQHHETVHDITSSDSDTTRPSLLRIGKYRLPLEPRVVFTAWTAGQDVGRTVYADHMAYVYMLPLGNQRWVIK